jgi:uncharacterized protein (DUF2384 family)
MTNPLKTATLFSSIPNKDHLSLLKKDLQPDGEKIAKILKFKRQDIASATNIPQSSIRYDDKMPAELKERLIEWAVALNLVAEYFNDTEKTILWFEIPNPLLGGISPKDMIKLGRFKKLRDFIQIALDENKR